MKANATDSGLKAASNTTGMKPMAADDRRIGSTGKEFKGRVLHLFSGPHGRQDGFAAHLEKLGWQCDEYDITNGDHEDLSSDNIWSPIIGKIRSGYDDAMLAGPPCNTYTNARKADDGGPRPLRSADGPGRYGLEDLSPEQREQVRLGNLFATRAYEAATLLDKQAKPSIIEQPKLRDDPEAVSMYKLDEFVEYRGRKSVREIEVAQCRYSAKTSKPTTLLQDRAGHLHGQVQP